MSLNPRSTVLENGHFSVAIRVENRTHCIWQWIYNWGWWWFWTAKMCLMSVLVAISFGLDLLFQNINRKWDEFGFNRIFQWGRRKLQICIFWPKKVRITHPNLSFSISAVFFTNIWRSLKPSLPRGRGCKWAWIRALPYSKTGIFQSQSELRIVHTAFGSGSTIGDGDYFGQQKCAICAFE